MRGCLEAWNEMVDDLQQRLLAMEQELVQQRGVNTTLQSLIAAGAATTTRSAIDTRGLGRPEAFDGTAETWRDWKVTMKSYTAACNDKLGALVKRAEETDNPVMNAALPNPGGQGSSEQLAFVLVMVCRGAALDQVVNAGPGEGLLAWRSLRHRFEPNDRDTRACCSASCPSISPAT